MCVVTDVRLPRLHAPCAHPRAAPAVTCPNDCSGHGTCQSMRYHASQMDKGLQPASFYYSYGSNWDADMIRGCACDSGFAGIDCSARVCPTGDDPMTTLQVNDVQLIRCDLDPAVYTTPTFTLSFRGAVSAPFAGNAPAAAVAAVLNAMPTVLSATVAYTGLFTTFCDNSNGAFAAAGPPLIPAGGNMVTITFASPTGPQPGVLVLSAAAALLTGVLDNNVWTAHGGASLPVGTGGVGGFSTITSVAGTKENAPCRSVRTGDGCARRRGQGGTS